MQVGETRREGELKDLRSKLVSREERVAVLGGQVRLEDGEEKRKEGRKDGGNDGRKEGRTEPRIVFALCVCVCVCVAKSVVQCGTVWYSVIQCSV